jgi:hypothetical protein
MRRLGWILVASACALATAGCNSRRGKPVETSAYRGVDQGVLLAFAWGGAPGFDSDEPSEVRVLVGVEPGDLDHRLLSCNPRQSDCKDLRDFTDTGEELEEGHDLLATYDTDVKKEDRLFVVVAERGSKLVTSEVISATASTRPTAFSNGELRFDRDSQKLAWPRVPSNDLYVLTLTDSRGKRPLTAIVTRRKSWTYPELQGIVQYLHDPARVGELRPGGRYLAVLYSLDKRNWATLVSNAVINP